MKDLTVMLENRPGALADLGEATAKAGVNIEGMGGDALEGRGVLHVLVEDSDAARRALAGVGIDVEAERDALVVDVEDRPGTMADVARRLAGAEINVDFVYATFGGCKLVLGVDDPSGARAAL